MEHLFLKNESNYNFQTTKIRLFFITLCFNIPIMFIYKSGMPIAFVYICRKVGTVKREERQSRILAYAVPA